MKNFRHLKTLLAISLIMFMGGTTHAQQTIFNVPSADVTPENHVFLQHESQFRPWQPGGFWLGTHYAAAGIGHHTELDATLINVSDPASENISLMLGAKSVIPIGEELAPDREIKLTLGGMLPVSLQGQGVDYWGYTHLSGRLPHVKTRLTAGVSAGGTNLFGRDTVCFIGGLEHPLSRHVTLLADWYSGTHSNANLISGFSVTLSPKNALYFGFQIPNNSRSGKSGFVFEWARYF